MKFGSPEHFRAIESAFNEKDARIHKLETALRKMLEEIDRLYPEAAGLAAIAEEAIKNA